jgi:hypothetical protein
MSGLIEGLCFVLFDVAVVAACVKKNNNNESCVEELSVFSIAMCSNASSDRIAILHVRMFYVPYERLNVRCCCSRADRSPSVCDFSSSLQPALALDTLKMAALCCCETPRTICQNARRRIPVTTICIL